MLKNRFLAAFALSGLVAFAACSAEEEPATDVNVEATEEVGAPVTPAPVVQDSLTAPATVDTGAAAVGATDTAAAAH